MIQLTKEKAFIFRVTHIDNLEWILQRGALEAKNHAPENPHMPLRIRYLRQGKVLPVYGDGKNIRDLLYVEDHNRPNHLYKGQTFGAAGQGSY